jgi:hypothetical protein
MTIRDAEFGAEANQKASQLWAKAKSEQFDLDRIPSKREMDCEVVKESKNELADVETH